MEDQQMSSLEWMGRVMGPDPLVHDIVVGGAERRRRQEKQRGIIEAAWTVEADAWNKLASISNLHQLEYIVIPGLSTQSVSWSKVESMPDEVLPFEEYRFVRKGYSGTLCEQWRLSGGRM